MIKQLFGKITDNEKREATEFIFTQSYPDPSFFLMIILSVAMASLGLLINSSIVIIGSMMIAPILYPILGLSMGIVMLDYKLIRHSLITTIKVMLICILSASLISHLLLQQVEYNEEILSRTNHSVIHALIGVVAGLAAAFAIVKPKLSETLPGVALSVSLLPPLAVTGIALSRFDFEAMLGAFLLFVVNIIGVVSATSFIFYLMNFYSERALAETTINIEEKIEELDEKISNDKKD